MKHLCLAFILIILLSANLLTAIEVTIGAGDEQARIPFDLSWHYSLYETIYFPIEINMAGMITIIKYYNNFPYWSWPGYNVRIWMGETNQSDLSDGWIPASQLTLVFDESVDFPQGENIITFILPQPYIYLGQNLVIMTESPFVTSWPPLGLNFYCQTTSPNRARNFYSDSTDPDPYNPPTTGYFLTGQFPKTTLQFSDPMFFALSGEIHDNLGNPVDGATVQVDGMGLFATTNPLGQYFISFVPPGTYQVTASKNGYASQTQSAAFVEDITTFLNFTLSRNTFVTVTGRIVNAFLPSEGVPNTAINVAGVANVVTDDAGYFTVPNVPADTIIAYSVYKIGYEPYSNTFETTNTDLNLGFILLNEIHSPPQDIIAVVNNPVINITWDAPNRALLGYRVWRFRQENMGNEGLWTLLTPNIITATSYSDNSWSQPGPGTWVLRWAVKACYSGGQVSLPAFSNWISGGSLTGAITGIVTNSQTGSPVSDAQIELAYSGGMNFSCVTDEQGIYSMITPSGTATLTVSADGFSDYEQEGVQITTGDTIIVDIALNPTSNPDEPEVIAATGLTGCYPNPFRDNINICYEIKEPVLASIEIYNLKGQKIRTLVNSSIKTGRYTLVWDGRDSQGIHSSNGVYFCRMQAGKYLQTEKLVLLK
jgi:hypothetical protein